MNPSHCQPELQTNLSDASRTGQTTRLSGLETFAFFLAIVKSELPRNGCKLWKL